MLLFFKWGGWGRDGVRRKGSGLFIFGLGGMNLVGASLGVLGKCRWQDMQGKGGAVILHC